MEIISRIWIEKDGEPFLGYGRIKLLKAINEVTSILAAAKSLNMSYKKTWDLVNDINSKASHSVVLKSIGGVNGGGTKVTEYGLSLIAQFEGVNQKCITFLDEEFKKVLICRQ